MWGGHTWLCRGWPCLHLLLPRLPSLPAHTRFYSVLISA